MSLGAYFLRRFIGHYGGDQILLFTVSLSCIIGGVYYLFLKKKDDEYDALIPLHLRKRYQNITGSICLGLGIILFVVALNL